MFAKRLKTIRTDRGLTQVQLAEMLGVSKGTVAMWETAKREPNFDTLECLSHVFDKRVDYLLGLSSDGSSAKASKNEVEQPRSLTTEQDFYEILMAFLQLDDYGKNAVEGVIKAETARCVEHHTLFPTHDFELAVRKKSSKSNSKK